MRSISMGVNEYLPNALECWVEPFHVITDRELLGMRRALCPVDCVITTS